MHGAEKMSGPGRKRAIPPEMAKVVWEILAQGFGYRRTAKILRDEYGLRLHWSRVRDFKKGQSCYGPGTSLNEDTTSLAHSRAIATNKSRASEKD